MPRGNGSIVAVYSGRSTARTGAAGVPAHRSATPRAIRTTRRMGPRVPSDDSAPLMAVVIPGRPLAVHRAGQSCAEADPVFLGIDEVVLRFEAVFGLERRIHTALREDELGAKRRRLLLRGLGPFQGRGELVAETSVVDRGLRRIAALSREPQLRLRVLRLGVRSAGTLLRLLQASLELEDLRLQ